MTKVVIELSMSLDGFIAGPDASAENALGTRGGHHVFDWYEQGGAPIRGDANFQPVGVNRDVVEAMFDAYGAMIFGRRTYDLMHGWGGSHPIPNLQLVVLTHNPPAPADVPQGNTTFHFVSDITAAITLAKARAGGKHVGIGGATAAQQGLAAGLVDEVYLHVGPLLLGAGVRLFDHLGDDAIHLEPLSVVPGPGVTHLRYRVARPRPQA